MEIDGKPVSEITELAADDFAGITRIGSGAFQKWHWLNRVTIPSSVTDIGDAAFVACIGLTSITVESGNRRYHSDGNCLIETGTKTLIAGCNTSIIPMDGSVTSIEKMAFAGCIDLTSVTIPDGVICIDFGVFLSCTSLTSVKIPSSVTSIEFGAFYYDDRLTTVQYGGTETDWSKINRKSDGLSGKTITGSDGSTWTAK